MINCTMIILKCILFHSFWKHKVQSGFIFLHFVFSVFNLVQKPKKYGFFSVKGKLNPFQERRRRRVAYKYIIYTPGRYMVGYMVVDGSF